MTAAQRPSVAGKRRKLMSSQPKLSQFKNLDLDQPPDMYGSHIGVSPNTIYKSIVDNSLRATIHADDPEEQLRENESPPVLSPQSP